MFLCKKAQSGQQIDKKLPICQSKKWEMITPIISKLIADQYKNESIITLNELEKADIEAEQYKRQSWTEDVYDY